MIYNTHKNQNDPSGCKNKPTIPLREKRHWIAQATKVQQRNGTNNCSVRFTNRDLYEIPPPYSCGKILSIF